jgi:oligopeptide transport system substrate-binding protein
MKRIVYILLSAILLCSLLIVGCQPPPPVEPPPVGPPPVGPPSPVPGEGGALTLYGIDPFTLDPAVSSESTSHEYVMQLFSGLVRLDDNLEPAPDIAQDWQISDDGRTYTFYLREDVTFHDGREVKAEDFKYSWERACAPETRSHTAATYLGDIVGVNEVLAGETAEISGVRVSDDYTLEVTIDAPKSYFLSKLTYPTSFVVDRTNVASGREWWHSPNGTGPFKLKQWEEGSLLVLERNELYYAELAKVDLVNFQLWGGVPMNMYETGEIDVTGVSSGYIDKVTDERGPFYQDLTAVPELSFFYIGFDTTKPPFDDANLRRAFSQAIDKDKLVSLVFRDTVQRADGILPPGMPGYNEDLSGLDFDVTEAKELIANSRYGDVSNLPPITITTGGWGGLISSGLEAIIYEWRNNLGVEVKVRQLEPERFMYHLMEEKDEMFDMGWIADYPHPQDFLDILFHSDTENNYGEYSNPEVDALLEMANVEPDNDLVKPYISGYQLNPMGFAMLNTVSVEPR